MPKAKPTCALCGKALKNREDAQAVHDRTCAKFKRLHAESVDYIQQHLAMQAAQPPKQPDPPLVADVQMAVDEPRPPSPPKFRKSGRPDRPTRLPARFQDIAPPRAPRLPPPPAIITPAIPEAEIELQTPVSEWVQTAPNEFGVYKVYPRRPTHDPDDSITLQQLYQVSQPTETHPDTLRPEEPWYFPFPNPSVAHMMKYHIEEEHPHDAQSDGRFADGLTKPVFDPTILGPSRQARYNSSWYNRQMVKRAENDAPVVEVSDILYRPLLDPIKEVLQGPLFALTHTTPFSLRAISEAELALADIIMADLSSPLNEYGLPPLAERHEEIFGEVYTSPAMLEAYRAIPQPPPPQSPEDPVESIIMAIMEWSDATHLAQFGTASLWPAYTFFGNHSKDVRCKPSSNTGFHQAYFTKLPDSIRDSYRAHYGCDMADDVYTHLKRELIHAIWQLLLSDDFMDAYDNGIKIKCWDGVVRLVFPRFFTYSADYPEKVLLSTIRSLGGCPCPRCFIQKRQIAETGTVNDMKRRQNIRIDDHPRRVEIEDARAAVFGNGNAVGGSKIDDILKAKSWVPVRNAFSKLNTPKTPFNLFTLFVPDLLHEIELGVAKALITHLIRMLQSFKNIDEFDQRFRQISSFGRNTIRSFNHNVSELKYAAARNYEDILQCILPTLEGLFPQHQALVDQLCFQLAVWHGYAKLRMHTTSSIQFFRTATTDLCTTIRRFARETRDVKTYELPREERRRLKQASKASTSATETVNPSLATAADSPRTTTDLLPDTATKSQSKSKSKSKGRRKNAGSSSASSTIPTMQVSASDAANTPVSNPVPPPTAAPVTQTKPKKKKVEKPFNPITYKLHSIPDYPDAIARYGTTDSTSTQIGEVAHRLVKYLYRRTNKRDHAQQIANHERRRRMMRAIKRATNDKGFSHLFAQIKLLDMQPTFLRNNITTSPILHAPSYISLTWSILATPTAIRMGMGMDHEYKMFRLRLRLPPMDPALKDFSRKLKSHLRRRLLNLEYTGDDLQFTDDELINVVLEKDALYTHATMRVNYTTYDLKRDQDVLNPRTRKVFPCSFSRPSGPASLLPSIMDAPRIIFQHLSLDHLQNMMKIGNFSTQNIVVDRDMLLRYHGNAIGHRKINLLYQRAATDESNQDLEAADPPEGHVEEEFSDQANDLDVPVLDDADNDEQEEHPDWTMDNASSGSDVEEEDEDEEFLYGDEACRSRVGF
ncbi:hypothetical protein MIND_00884300 [Mycena indigotica]|uniref:Uncharacterized protein n=1 Tax=Mycena indigotica TaxID=2126181 RepID=A0A8H6SIP1_9AGAR|nr:uncharacterized protein MIND_00884300 [Mycena indigotica]KAF7299351.1 hypothetical protein MIND_00884300 [Mycena indigotica]